METNLNKDIVQRFLEVKYRESVNILTAELHKKEKINKYLMLIIDVVILLSAITISAYVHDVRIKELLTYVPSRFCFDTALLLLEYYNIRGILYHMNKEAIAKQQMILLMLNIICAGNIVYKGGLVTLFIELVDLGFIYVFHRMLMKNDAISAEIDDILNRNNSLMISENEVDAFIQDFRYRNGPIEIKLSLRDNESIDYDSIQRMMTNEIRAFEK